MGVDVYAHTYMKILKTFEIIKPKSAQLKSLFILQIYEMFALQHFLLLLQPHHLPSKKKIFLLLLLLLLLLVLVFCFFLTYSFIVSNAVKCEKLKYYRHYFIFDLET